MRMIVIMIYGIIILVFIDLYRNKRKFEKYGRLGTTARGLVASLCWSQWSSNSSRD